MRRLLQALVTLAVLAPGLAYALPSSASIDEAALLYRRGRYPEALERLRSANAVSPSARSELLLGLTLRRMGKEGEAVAALQRAHALDPASLDAAINLGLAQSSTGRFSEAEKTFQEALRSHPAKPEPLLGLGELAASRADLAAAKGYLGKALALDARRASAWLALSDVLLRLGELRPAVEAREKALALGTSEGELWFKQAALWYGLGEVDKAAAALAKAEGSDKPETYFLAGCIDHRRGDFAAAERNFLAALEARPKYPEARLNLGISYYAAGRYPEAIEQFKQLRSPAAMAELAGQYVRESQAAAADHLLRSGGEAVLNGDFAAGMDQWARAEALAEDKGAVRKMLKDLRAQQKPRAEALALQGEEAKAKSDLPSAVLFWGEALKIDPENARARASLRSAESDLEPLRAAYRSAGLRQASEGDFTGTQLWVERLSKLDPKAGASLAVELKALARAKVVEIEKNAVEAQQADQPEKALQLYTQAQGLLPEDRRLIEKGKQARSLLRAKQGRLLASAAELEAGKKLQAAHDAYRAVLQLDANDLEARQGAERLARRLNLKNLDAKAVDQLYYKGVYLYGAGETKKALELWRQALEASPGNRPLLQAVHSAETKLRTLAQLDKARP